MEQRANSTIRWYTLLHSNNKELYEVGYVRKVIIDAQLSLTLLQCSYDLWKVIVAKQVYATMLELYKTCTILGFMKYSRKIIVSK
jgi:hypothetical protein